MFSWKLLKYIVPFFSFYNWCTLGIINGGAICLMKKIQTFINICNFCYLVAYKNFARVNFFLTGDCHITGMLVTTR